MVDIGVPGAPAELTLSVCICHEVRGDGIQRIFTDLRHENSDDRRSRLEQEMRLGGSGLGSRRYF